MQLVAPGSPLPSERSPPGRLSTLFVNNALDIIVNKKQTPAEPSYPRLSQNHAEVHAQPPHSYENCPYTSYLSRSSGRSLDARFLGLGPTSARPLRNERLRAGSHPECFKFLRRSRPGSPPATTTKTTPCSSAARSLGAKNPPLRQRPKRNVKRCNQATRFPAISPAPTGRHRTKYVSPAAPNRDTKSCQ